MLISELENLTHLSGFPKDWQVLPIESLCLKVTSGGTPSRKNPDFYKNGSILWIKTQELKDWYIEDSQEKITEEALKKSSAKLLPVNTVLMAMYGDGRTITSLGILRKEAATNQACCALVPNLDICEPLYLFYLLTFHRNHLIKLTLGGAQRNLSGTIIRNFKVKVPPLPIQRKIAAILSGYDRLIENNTRRIEILEEMARSIYREWFVKFRFPGHEQVQMVDSELGRIPEGWEVRNLSEICEIIMGLSPKSEFYNENAEGLPLHQGVTNFGVWFPTDKVYTTAITRLAQTGDILFSVRAPVGRINIANKTIVIGRGICAIRSKTGKQNFVLQQLRDKFYEDNLMGGGTIYPSVTKEEVQKIKLLVPFPEKILAFESQSLPIFRQIEVFLLKNRNLRQTRDLLLPRLISGEIDVENLDINTGEIAA